MQYRHFLKIHNYVINTNMADGYEYRELTSLRDDENIDSEISQIKSQSEMNNELRNIPHLPNNKDYHMFICYIQDDVEDVRIIVDNLEQNGVKCCYHERDFLPGQQVIGNIHESINRSMSMLIVLSENFVQSRFCKHEIEQALHAKIEDDYTIIPIKVQRCQIPHILKNYTHIDAELDNPSDRHKKILKAFIYNVWHSRQMAESNGFTMECWLSKYTISWKWLSLYRYKMFFDAASRRKISRNGFEISDKILSDIEQVVNGSSYIKYIHITNKFSRMTTFFFFMIFLIYLGVGSVISEALRPPTINKQETGYGIMYGLLGIFLLWLSLLLFHGFGVLGNFNRWKGMTKSLKQRTKAQLMRSLWLKINKNTIDSNNFIVIFSNWKLHIMRFDRDPCRNFFIRRCSVNEDLKLWMLPSETCQEYTDRLFDNYLQENIEMMLVESLSSGRHTMINGAKCLCQLVQDKLLPQEII